MVLEKQQMVQFFQMSMDDLKAIIKDAVSSVTPPPVNNTNLALEANASNPDDDLLTREQVKNILKVSYPTLWKFNKDGVLKIKLKIGRRVYYSKRDLYNLINNAA